MAKNTQKDVHVEGLGVTFRVTHSGKVTVAEIIRVRPNYMRAALKSKKKRLRFTGKAFCHKDDTYSEKTGQDIAIARAYSRLLNHVRVYIAKEQLSLEEQFNLWIACLLKREEKMKEVTGTNFAWCNSINYFKKHLKDLRENKKNRKRNK